MTRLTAGASAVSLVPGDPAAIRRLARRLEVLTGGLDDAAGQLSAIESGTWRGGAGDAFRSILGDQPGKFRRGAASFRAARGACLTYADVLEAAQHTARRAADDYGASMELSQRWRARADAYAALQQRAKGDDAAAALQIRSLVGPPGLDPGAQDRAAAERLLETGRAQVCAAAERAAAALEEARRSAPKQPGVLRRAAHWGSEFASGVSEALWGLGTFGWTYSTLRLVLDHKGWSRDVGSLRNGLGYGVLHPIEFGKAIVDWDTWQASPARAIGHLAPDVLLALASGGAGTVASRGEKVAATVKRLATVADRVETATKPARPFAAAQSMHDLQQFRSAVGGGGYPPGFTPGDGSPAALAAGQQRARPGARIDRWSNTRLRPGDLIAATGSAATSTGLRPMAVPLGVADSVGTSAGALRQSMQTKPDPASDLDQITVLRVNESVDIAASRALANPQHGAGGAVAIYIPDLHELIDRGVLTVVEVRSLDTTAAIR